jgi:hypothetical protein
MKERCISADMVRAALSSPEKVDCSEKRKIAQKFIGGKLLRIIFEEEDETIIVISAYSTSKISKYSRRQE